MVTSGAALAAPASVQDQPFADWLDSMKAEAVAAGIPAPVVAQALNGARPLDQVLRLDRSQPEFTTTFHGYLGRAVPAARVRKGQEMLTRHAALLNKIATRYNVQPRFIVALWGLETDYGGNTGSISTIDALATLAWHGRRGPFFRAQLLDALRIIAAGHVRKEDMRGSWAGAIGQVQFMPSTFQAHAVDGDGDGRIDLWNSLPDAFASAANYLSSLNWSSEQTWGREVRLPPSGFDFSHTGLSTEKTLAEWTSLGVRQTNGSPLPTVAGISASMLLPAGARGPAFLVYDNYHAVLDWNRSLNYALAVGLLSDWITGKPGLTVGAPANDRPLRTSEAQEIQERLNALGFNVGTADGKIGRMTREGIRRFQASVGLPQDGHADAALLTHLRRAGQTQSGRQDTQSIVQPPKTMSPARQDGLIATLPPHKPQEID